jgi:hypothetical protein
LKDTITSCHTRKPLYKRRKAASEVWHFGIVGAGEQLNEKKWRCFTCDARLLSEKKKLCGLGELRKPGEKSSLKPEVN